MSTLGGESSAEQENEAMQFTSSGKMAPKSSRVLADRTASARMLSPEAEKIAELRAAGATDS